MSNLPIGSIPAKKVQVVSDGSAKRRMTFFVESEKDERGSEAPDGYFYNQLKPDQRSYKAGVQELGMLTNKLRDRRERRSLSDYNPHTPPAASNAPSARANSVD